jgi:UDP-N-acetylglucosamine acyltransferase
MSVYMPNSLYTLIDQGIVEMDPSAEVAQEVIFCVSETSSRAPIRIGKNCRVGFHAILYEGATLEENARIGHQTVIGANVRIGRSSSIGNACIIGPGVRLGEDNHVEHHAVIDGKAQIGERNQIGSFVTIGAPPQHPRITQAHEPVRIGNDNVLREYVSVHSSAEDHTEIGSHCFIMAYSCVNHDVIVEDYVTIANNCNLAGYVLVKHHANLGMGCVIHQHSVVGAGVMLGMGSIVAKDVPPFVTFYAGQVHKLNAIGLHRMGYSQAEIEALAEWYCTDTSRSLAERIEGVPDNWWYGDLKSFLEKSQRKIYPLGQLQVARQ